MAGEATSTTITEATAKSTATDTASMPVATGMMSMIQPKNQRQRSITEARETSRRRDSAVPPVTKILRKNVSKRNVFGARGAPAPPSVPIPIPAPLPVSPPARPSVSPPPPLPTSGAVVSSLSVVDVRSNSSHSAHGGAMNSDGTAPAKKMIRRVRRGPNTDGKIVAAQGSTVATDVKAVVTQTAAIITAQTAANALGDTADGKAANTAHAAANTAQTSAYAAAISPSSLLAAGSNHSCTNGSLPGTKMIRRVRRVPVKTKSTKTTLAFTPSSTVPPTPATLLTPSTSLLASVAVREDLDALMQSKRQEAEVRKALAPKNQGTLSASGPPAVQKRRVRKPGSVPIESESVIKNVTTITNDTSTSTSTRPLPDIQQPRPRNETYMAADRLAFTTKTPSNNADGKTVVAQTPDNNIDRNTNTADGNVVAAQTPANTAQTSVNAGAVSPSSLVAAGSTHSTGRAADSIKMPGKNMIRRVRKAGSVSIVSESAITNENTAATTNGANTSTNSRPSPNSQQPRPRNKTDMAADRLASTTETPDAYEKVSQTSTNNSDRKVVSAEGSAEAAEVKAIVAQPATATAQTAADAPNEISINSADAKVVHAQGATIDANSTAVKAHPLSIAPVDEDNESSEDWLAATAKAVAAVAQGSTDTAYGKAVAAETAANIAQIAANTAHAAANTTQTSTDAAAVSSPSLLAAGSNHSDDGSTDGILPGKKMIRRVRRLPKKETSATSTTAISPPTPSIPSTPSP